jgi:hypothetical protein
MSLYEDSLQYGVATTAVQAGDLDFGTKAGAVALGALHSGLGSIYNTGVGLVNALGGDLEETKTKNFLDSMDSDMGKYYQENKHAIDAAGFIATSLLPGMLAIKGLNYVRGGETIGAVGKALQFPRTKMAQSIEAGLSDLAVEGGTVFTQINRNKAAAMGWEVADQVLQAATFETAVALTMKQSPLLADDSWWDIGKGIATGAALGGVVGGTIGGLILNKEFKNAVRTVDREVNKAGNLALSGLENTNLSGGDKAMALMDSISQLPQEIHNAPSPVRFNFTLGGEKRSFPADLAPLIEKSKQASVRKALEQFELDVRKLTSGGDAATGGEQPEAAEAFANFLLKRQSELLKKGASSKEITDRMGDILYNATSVRAATSEPLFNSSDYWYFRKSLPPDQVANIKSLDDLKKLSTGQAPSTKDAYEKPFVFLGSPTQFANQRLAAIGREGEDGFPTLKAAWDAGHDMAMMPDGALRVNFKSGLWKQVEDQTLASRQYLNTYTGAFSSDTILTAADLAKAGTKLDITPLGVISTKTNGDKKVINMAARYNAEGDVEYHTARHAWASELTALTFPREVASTDISLLSRLSEFGPDFRDSIIVHHPDGSTSTGEAASSILLRNKVEGIKQLFDSGMQDTREVAYRFATSQKWVEELVGKEFGHALRDFSALEEGSRRELNDFLSRENLLVSYARPQQFTALDTIDPKLPWRERRDALLAQAQANGGQFVEGEVAWAHRVQQAITANRNAAASVLGGETLAKFPELTADAARKATSLGSGATFFGAANANHGTIDALFQQIGKLTHGEIQNSINNVMDSFSAAGTLLLNNKQAAAEVGIIRSLVSNAENKFVVDASRPNAFIDREMARAPSPEAAQARKTKLEADGQRSEIIVQNPDAMQFLLSHMQINGERLEKEKVLATAKGLTSNKDSTALYFPPIDTNYFQHFAFVKPVDGKMFGTSEVAMIFGRDAKELSERMGRVDRQLFDVITKDGTERYYKAKGLYDFDQTINERSIDSSLRRSGALANFQPETRVENIVEDFIRFHTNQETKVVRNAIETHYAQQVAELRSLGDSYVGEATSKFSGTSRTAKSEVANPYGDYIKTMLDVSKRSEYPLFHQINEFIDAVGTRAYRMADEVFGKARDGLIPWTEANAIAEQHGIKGLYSDRDSYFLTNAPRDRNLIKETIAKANGLLSNLVLRFDFAQAAINVISTPMLGMTEYSAIKATLKDTSSEEGKALRELLHIGVPGSDIQMPTYTKALFQAVKNFHGPQKQELLDRYLANGDIKNTLHYAQEAIDNLSLSPNFKLFNERVEKAGDIIGKITRTDWAEQFTRFVTADVARQITEPAVALGKMDLATANTFISTVVNRVQGNYITSQRPIVFQGVTGSAMGLFQTYSFNLLQQLFRHIEDRNIKAIGTMYGMQAGLFGLNGLPMFDAINTHIIGNAGINKGHYDSYSLAPELLGKKLGDWLMYGTASAFPLLPTNAPALYSRGDINPRHIAILPTSLSEIPAIDASIRTVTNLKSLGSKLIGGADIGTTLLEGLEHNGINRPLAGLAQLALGQSTTSRGNLISAQNDFSLITSAARIAGAKPMDEAIALNNNYRLNAYTIADKDRMEQLGETVKTKLLRNQLPADDELMGFMHDYARIGGRIENFNGAIQHWSKDANTSVVEKLRSNLNNPVGRRLSEVMGGVPLEDNR